MHFDLPHPLEVVSAEDLLLMNANILKIMNIELIVDDAYDEHESLTLFSFFSINFTSLKIQKNFYLSEKIFHLSEMEILE